MKKKFGIGVSMLVNFGIHNFGSAKGASKRTLVPDRISNDPFFCDRDSVAFSSIDLKISHGRNYFDLHKAVE